MKTRTLIWATLVLLALPLSPLLGAQPQTPQAPPPALEGEQFLMPPGGEPDCLRPVLPPWARLFGKSLTQWIEDYWRWYLVMGGPAPYYAGPGRAVFMPIPQGEHISGSFTPEDPGLLRGQIEVTLEPGTPFILPQFGLIGEFRADMSRDPFIPYKEVRKIVTDAQVTLNGKPIAWDLWWYYVGPQLFDPYVWYAEPGPEYIGASSFQGNGFIWQPLPCGTHTIKLYEKMILWPDQVPGWGSWGVIYDNTWIVHVVPGNPNPGIVPPYAKTKGKTYGEWAAAWWQWALSIPADRNPLLDPDGGFCDEGQRGPVWFYAGTFGSNAERWCTVPAGKKIFMPVYNWIFGAAVFDCEPTVPGVPCHVPTLRAKAGAAVNRAEIVDVTIDDEPVQDIYAYRQVCPEPFEVTLPAGAVFGLPAGTFAPHVTDGYWLMLEPLPKGEHTLRAYVYAPGEPPLEFEIITHLTIE